MFPSAKTVFIGDSDPLTHKQIHSVLTNIKKAFPTIDRITTYARAFTLAKTAINDLIKFKKSGLTRVHVGLESGDPIILKKMPNLLGWNSVFMYFAELAETITGSLTPSKPPGL